MDAGAGSAEEGTPSRREGTEDLRRNGAPRAAGREDVSATERERGLEEILEEFLLRREEGGSPTLEEYQARHPRFAEDLAYLLADELDPLAPPVPDIAAATGGDERTLAVDPHGAGAARSDDAVVGPYEILEIVARGGGGTVCRARHRRDHHLVALKVLERRAVTDPRDLERFQREARLLRALDLVTVVPVYDVGEDGGRLWIAMKWIEGRTLAGLVEDVREPSHQFHSMAARARLVARIARTLGAIHGHGIFHRDVKPSNVMVDRLGEPVVIDFGIARAPDLLELTQTLDGPMGTPRYLAPELLRAGNAEASARSDLYGLGLCLYELCTGARAFSESNRVELFGRIQHKGPVPPREASREVPHALEAIILRAIEIDPGRRYASMSELAADLERFAEGKPPERLTLRRAHPLRRLVLRHRRALVPAALLLVLLGAATYAGISKLMHSRRVSEIAAALEPFAFVPPEAWPLARTDLARLVREWRPVVDDRPDLGLRCAWIAYLQSDFAVALEMLPDASAALPAAGLFRDYLSLLVDRMKRRERTQETVSTNPDLQNASGKGFGDRFEGEIRESFDLAPDEDARRQGWIPPEREALDDLLERHPAAAGSPEVALMRALILWQSLPSSVVGEACAERRDEILRELAGATRDGESLAWARWVRAVLGLREGQREPARAELARLVSGYAGFPAVVHAHALACSSVLGEGGDAGTASSEFQRAAALYEEAREARPEVARYRLLWDPLRKLYAAWALHELACGRASETARVLERWRKTFGDGFWADRVMPVVIEARLREAASDGQGAVRLLREASLANVVVLKDGGETVQRFALLLREAARISESELGDDEGAKRLELMALRTVQKVPASIDAWIRGNDFGLRPYSPKSAFASDWQPSNEFEPAARPR